MKWEKVKRKRELDQERGEERGQEKEMNKFA